MSSWDRSASAAPLASPLAARPAPRPVVLLAGGALLVTVVAESVAIALRAPWLAVVAIVSYGLAFVVLPALGWRVVMIALLIALPLVTVEVGFGSTARTLSTDKVALAGVAAVWLLRRPPGRWRGLARIPAVGFWSIFLAVVLVSSLRMGWTLEQGWGVFREAGYALVFLAALDQFADAGSRRAALRAAGLVSGAVAAVGLLEWALRALGYAVTFYFKHGTMYDDAVAGSTIGHVNFFGAYLTLTMPVLAAVWLTPRGRGRWAVSIPFGLAALALFYAASMGAWLGLAAGAGVFAWFAAMSSLPRRLKRWTGFGTLLVAALGLTAISLQAPHSPASFKLRAATHRIGLAAIADRPFLGHGTDGFSRSYYHYEQRVFGGPLGQFRVGGEKLSAHSSFLDVAVDRGVLGLAAFLALLAAIIVPGFRGSLRVQTVEDRFLSIGALSGLLGFAVQALTENLFGYSKVAAIFWIMAAAVVRLTERTAARSAA